MFSPQQPDLNWENPQVRQAVYAIMRFWLDKGVDGFRMDVINMISKPWDAQGRLPDAPTVREGRLQPAFHLACNGPRLGDFLADMRREVLDHYPDTLTVGEAPLATVAVGRELTHPETGSLNMLFQFEHVDLDAQPGHVLGKFARRPLDWRDMKASMARWQTGLHQSGWNSLYFCNHDQPRSVSRWGVDSGALRNTSAKALATWLHGMQGTPYVYQGEELGMGNVAFERIEDYRDIESLNFHRVATSERGLTPRQALACIHAVGRDNARTPMQWTAGPQAGFTTGTPWIALNPDHCEVNAQAALAQGDSVFHHYRQLIALRKQHAVLREGAFELLWPDHPQLCGYIRHLAGDCLLVVANMGLAPVSTPWPVQLLTPSDSSNTAASAVSRAHHTTGTPRCLLANLSTTPERWTEPVLHLRPYEALMLLFTEAQTPASA
jgi:oligo-1,6-glucosidase